jgi:RND family efflux transporter MFP subunit
MIKLLKILVAITFLLAIGYGIVATLSNNVDKQQLQAKESRKVLIPSVEVQTVETKTVERKLKVMGIFRPLETLALLSETDGKVQSIDFELNKVVKQGQVLVKVDAQSKQTHLNIAKLNFQKAKRDFERFEALFKNNNLSEYDLENARFQMQNTEQNLDLAQQALNFTVIKSPIAGTISQKMIGIGTFLQVGSPVVEITDISYLRLLVNLAAQDLDKVKIGQEINITVPVRKEKTFSGTVKSIAVQSTEAGTFSVEILMPNTTSAPVLAGMNAEVVFSENMEHRALLIPRIALAGSQVFVVENGKAVAKKVSVGKEYGEEIEVLSGLEAGEQIIIRGQNNIENGQQVKIK